MLGPKYYRQKKDMRSDTRQKDIDAIRYDALILQLAKQHGYVKRADVVELLHVTPPQAYWILVKLVNKGILVCVGKGAGAKYVPAS